MIKGEAVARGEPAQGFMVGRDDGDFDAELARTLPVKQIVQTVARLRDHNERAHASLGRIDRGRHEKRCKQRAQRPATKSQSRLRGAVKHMRMKKRPV